MRRLFLLPLIAFLVPTAFAQPRIGLTTAMGIGQADGNKAAVAGTWEYRSGTRAFSVRGGGVLDLFGDSAFELAVMGGVAQGERGLGRTWVVAGPSLLIYETRRSCLFSGLGSLGGSSCDSDPSYSPHPGLSFGAGATFFRLGLFGVGGYLFGNLNLKAPMAGATLQFSLSGPAGRR